MSEMVNSMWFFRRGNLFCDNMRSEVESVIRQMAETDVKELVPLGIQYGSTLFPERKRAVVKEEDCYYLLLPEGSDKNEAFTLLTI